MRAREAFNELVSKSGMSKIKLSNAIGKSDNYLSNYSNRGVTPGPDVLASVADVCGYDLLLRNRESGEELVIDPPND